MGISDDYREGNLIVMDGGSSASIMDEPQFYAMVKVFPHKQKVSLGSNSKPGQDREIPAVRRSLPVMCLSALCRLSQVYIPFHSGPFGPMQGERWTFFS